MAPLADKHTSAAQKVTSPILALSITLSPMHALGDAPSPSIAGRMTSLDPGPHLRSRAFGIGLDTISSTNLLSIPSVAPSDSCAPCHPKIPGLRASGLPTATCNKENVRPVPQSADVYPVEVQQLFIPPFPTPSSLAHPHDLDPILP